MDLDAAVAVESAREGRDESARAAALLYDLVVDEIGHADAASVARAVLESRLSVPKMSVLVRGRRVEELAAELRRLHLTERVVTRIAARLRAHFDGGQFL